MDFCSKCGEALTPGSKYCPKCGALSTTLPASFTPPQPPAETGQDSTNEPEVPPVIVTDEPDSVGVAAPGANAALPSATVPSPWGDSQGSVIASAHYRKLNFGERLFTFLVVVLFASVVASVFTASVAFISTFMGDPFRVKPMLKGWGMDLWGETPMFQVNTAMPAPAPVVAAPMPATDPAVQVKPLPETRTSVSFQSSGAGAREASRSQARLFAAMRPNMEGINQAWDKVLSANPNWPSSEMKVQVQLDKNGRAVFAEMVANENVPKVVSDQVLNTIRRTNFGRAANVVTTTITFRFGMQG